MKASLAVLVALGLTHSAAAFGLRFQTLRLRATSATPVPASSASSASPEDASTLQEAIDSSVTDLQQSVAAQCSKEWEEYLDRLINEQRELLNACANEAECAVLEADQMREQLSAFANARGWDGLMKSLSLESMRVELRAIIKRRRHLVELAAIRQQQASVHGSMLRHLDQIRQQEQAQPRFEA